MTAIRRLAARLPDRPLSMKFLVALVLISVALLTTGSATALASHVRDGVRSVEVGEKDGVAKVVIRFDCPSEKPGRVDYRTKDGTAIAERDYRQLSGSSSITHDAPVTIEVPILDDGEPEGAETVRILVSFYGGQVPFMATGVGSCYDPGWCCDFEVTVTIRDDDPLQTGKAGASNRSGAAPTRSDTAAGSTARPNPDRTTSSTAPALESTVAAGGDEEVGRDPFATKSRAGGPEEEGSFRFFIVSAILLATLTAGFAMRRRLGRRST